MGSLVLSPSWRAACGKAESACTLRRSRLVLVEPHGLLRDGLAHLISMHIRDAAVECFDRVEDVVPGPANLLVIGVDPRRDGDAEAMQVKFGAVRALCGDAPIGAVLACDDAALTRAVSAAGVAGVVRREESLAVAIAAIQLMWVGGFCLPREHSREEEIAGVVQASPAPAREPRPIAMSPEPSRKEVYCEIGLTARECDVLKFLREGHQNKIIAFELGISESTVKVHLRNLMKKLHASNRTQVALGAISAE